MQTIKLLNYSENGALSVSEFELDAYRRFQAQYAEYRAYFPELDLSGDYVQQVQEVKSLIDEPVIEPLFTWEIGTFDPEIIDLVEMMNHAQEWLGKRTKPLGADEIPEMLEFLQAI